ncbi:MAG: LexA family transcriptional regulator [Rhodobacteraceae bacterium]|nr:LexA family transcriptional regulator [Paracoccaceae bacterium]
MIDAKSLFELIETRRNELGLTQSQVTERALNSRAGTSVIQNIRRGSIPSAQKLNAICDALGLEFYIGNQRTEVPPKYDRAGFAEAGTLPLQGFTSSNPQGWGRSRPEGNRIAKPEGWNDRNAFYVRADGHSMIPEGIAPGQLCLVSPARPPKPGDHVWVKDKSGRTAIKMLVSLNEKDICLRGWLPEQNGQQSPYDEHLLRDYVAELSAIVDVFDNTESLSRAQVEPDSKFSDQMGDPDSRFASTSPEQEDYVIVSLHAAQAAADLDNRPLTGLALPNSWFKEKQMSPQNAALIVVQDDDMSPTLAMGSVALVDLSRVTPVGGPLFSVRLDGSVRVVRLEQPDPATLIVAFDNPACASRVLTGSDIGSVGVLGQVIWAGSDL